MSLLAFEFEEQVTVGEDTLTLRVDFRVISICEGALQSDWPSIVASVRGGRPQVSVLAQMLWAMLREHHSEVTLNQATGIIYSPEAPKVGFAVSELLNRSDPLPKEDRKPKKAPTPRGRSKSSVDAG